MSQTIEQPTDPASQAIAVVGVRSAMAARTQAVLVKSDEDDRDDDSQTLNLTLNPKPQTLNPKP